MKVKKQLGIDLGTSSIGIAEYEITGTKYKLKHLESSIFDEPIVVPERGAAFTKNTEKRSSRLTARQVERKSKRHKKLRYLYPLLGITKEAIKESLKSKPNIFALRAQAVSQKVSLAEFMRILAHINNNRGYKGNLKSDTGKVRKNIENLKEQLKANNLTTLGQLWYYQQQQAEKGSAWKNLHKVAEGEGTNASRDLMEEEFRKIWQEQQKYHSSLKGTCQKELSPYFQKLNTTIGLPLEEIFYQAIFYQRPIYWKFDRVGDCPIYPKQKRASKAHLSFQKYRIAKKLLDIKIKTREDKKAAGTSSLNIEQMKELYNLLNDSKSMYNENNEVSYNDLYEKISLSPDLYFNIDKRADKSENKGIKGNATIYAFNRAGLWDNFSILSPISQSILINFLSNITDYANILDADEDNLKTALADISKLTNSGEDTTKDIDAAYQFLAASFISALEGGKPFSLETGRAQYSVQALERLTEGLLLGETENSILESLGYDSTDQKPKGKLNPLSSVLTNNPIIDRVLRIYERKIAYYTAPENIPQDISIEMSRDLKNSLAQRKEIENNQTKYAKALSEIRKDLLKKGISPSSYNIRRYRLWQEADTKCPYCGQNISEADALNQNTEVDHIIPRAVGGPNRYFNMVLCHQQCNNNKSNLTPFQAWSQGLANEDAIQSFSKKLKEKADKIKKSHVGNKWVKPLERIDLEKKASLLITKKTAEQLFDFSDRSATETAWMSKIILNWSHDISLTKPTATRGSLTAYLRKKWGLDHLLAKIRIEENRPLFNVIPKDKD
ncbi:MAG: type II CRISPR RNA-guided endonuclease Cas9, partial [Alphaproteobacteria bacterium]